MKELNYSSCNGYYCRWIGRTRVGKVLRTLVIISNILYWFAGCAILSVAIWLRFVDAGTKDYFSTFQPVDTALYVVLVASLLFLVASFVGTCAANTKNELMIALYITVVFVVSVAEIISLIVYSSSHLQIEEDFGKWYKGHFEKYQDEKPIHKEVVNHVQSKMKCCGISGSRDYFTVFDNETIPNSCVIQIEIAENIYRPDVYNAGCRDKLNELILWLLKGWPLPFVATCILLLEIVGIVTSALLLQHIVFRKKFNYDDDEGESSDLIGSGDDTKSANISAKQFAKIKIDDLPRPKLFRVVKSPVDEKYGFDIGYDEERNCYIVTNVQAGSNAEYGGILKGSQIIELNGLMLQGVDLDEVYDKMDRSGNEILLVTVEEKTEHIYKTNKVAVNLKNLEGVTSDVLDYKPRLCDLKKGTKGFGFHLLYLEDRKGEYIEEVAIGSPAKEAGLSVGDRIIEVNDTNIELEKSSEVVKRIRMSGDSVSLVVVDPKTDGYFRKKGVTLSKSLTKDFYIGRMPSVVPTSVTEKRRNFRDSKPRYCKLVKTEKEDYGLYVVIDNNRIGQVIRWVDCGGPADRAGLRIGDRIVEVNGHSVEYESHQRLIGCISINKTISQFIVVDEDYDRIYKRNKPRLCRIFKESGSFGFCVYYLQNKDGHYIEEVDQGGPAERAGLRVNDRIIQIDGINVEKETHQNVLNTLRGCESSVVLLVIDAKSNKHYKRIVKFKSEEMKDIDFDAVPIPEEPLFLRDDEDSVTLPSDQVSISANDTPTMRDTQSKESAAVTLMGDDQPVRSEHASHRDCIVRMSRQEKQGFDLLVDRDRNGLIVKNLTGGGPGERAGLKDGDRITSVNGDRITGLNHDEVLEKIQRSGRRFTLSVVEENSDNVSEKHRPYLFRITKGDGGYGFYLWFDDNGHYVEEVTVDSPADKSGMRSGDRVIEVNGVNVEEETHEEVFYRVKASMNAVTLLAVDQKTFKLYRKHKIPVSIFKAETGFSGELEKNIDNNLATKKTKTVTHQVELEREKGDFGFNLAFSNAFFGDPNCGSHIVHWVEIGGPAYEAGLRDGDKIVAVDEEDVTNEEPDQVIARIHQYGKKNVILTIEYEEEFDAFVQHIVTIKKIDNSFGFHLWFDQNGHFIEDVTIGSPSDVAGLKTGDRVLKVNGKDVEDSSHAEVVALVRQGSDEVSLEVLNVQNEDVGDFSAPTICTLMKERGTFGFTLSQDGQGFHFDYVESFSPAEKMGISVGDRLLEVDGEPISATSYSDVVSRIRRAGITVTLTVISSGKNFGSNKAEALKFESYTNQIFDELDRKDKIDFVVEKKRFSSKDGLVGDLRSDYRDGFGKDNPALTIEDEVDYRISSIDDIFKDDMKVKGRILDEKLLPQASSAATMRRRRPGKNIYSKNRRFVERKPDFERRKRSLLDIEHKLGHNWKKLRSPSDSERVLYKKEVKNESQKRKHFHLVTSKAAFGQKWDFEEGDSRRAGENNAPVVDSIAEVEEDMSYSFGDNGQTSGTVNNLRQGDHSSVEEMQVHLNDDENSEEHSNVADRTVENSNFVTPKEGFDENVRELRDSECGSISSSPLEKPQESEFDNSEERADFGVVGNGQETIIDSDDLGGDEMVDGAVLQPSQTFDESNADVQNNADLRGQFDVSPYDSTSSNPDQNNTSLQNDNCNVSNKEPADDILRIGTAAAEEDGDIDEVTRVEENDVVGEEIMV